MTRLVLLPGMDGTGDLFAAFASAFDGELQVVRYPTDRPLGYADLENLVISELPSDCPYVLLGESFAGPLALSIASAKPALLRGVVLSCSFAKNPRPGLGPLRGVVNWLPDRPPIDPLLWLLAGRFATPVLREALARAVGKVSPAVLRARMAAVAGANVVPMLHAIAVPLLYLQGSEDRVIPPRAARTILENVAGSRLAEFEAPHLLLQTRPKEAAAVIGEFVREVEHGI